MVKDETGSVFGRLTVVYQLESQKGKAVWYCRCVCGCVCFPTGDALRSGKTQSCGCYRASGDYTRKHGHGSYTKGVSRTYKSWQEMRARCSNPKHISYPNYGGRGIVYDPAWDRFEQFLSDMGERPANTSIDRVDGDLGYSRMNCRWSTRQVQNAHRRNVEQIEHLGRSQSLAEWCRELGLPYPRTYHRLKVQGKPFTAAIL